MFPLIGVRQRVTQLEVKHYESGEDIARLQREVQRLFTLFRDLQAQITALASYHSLEILEVPAQPAKKVAVVGRKVSSSK